MSFRYPREESLPYKNLDMIRGDLERDIEKYFENGGKIKHLEFGLRQDPDSQDWKSSRELDKGRKRGGIKKGEVRKK